jgi:pimeloyl-ACP methyl ester carboxylesterase
VLAISADLDLLAPEPTVRALHATISDVTFGSVAQAAHSVHWEKPAEVAELINGFLR